ncbi:predicted protein [Naegleria gruberi]|uniref:Predicted protein n=1 Tax=Naegleria gruberi TaxID=5762 RepID=D2VB12_NAEGR|nr:uncharacterized protein NAEGRDRAFT_66050 [Naegleria gruberi]EFC46178.1 predicted protein [Naegleria gruberi]|eukprot:XP_002678922.1 predicted protein [Naegleria gruberi strain NEG-M]
MLNNLSGQPQKPTVGLDDSLIQRYKFNIEAVFDHESARDCFRKFLKDNLNEDPFMFYEMVEKYQKTRLDKNRFDMAVEIMNTFIVVSAKHELNLSMTIRKDILKIWSLTQEFNEGKAVELIECPSDLFQKAQNVIFSELKQDNFPRFTESEQFKSFLKKEAKKPEYKDSPSQLLEQLGTKKALDRSDSSISQDSSDSDSFIEEIAKSTPIKDKDRPLIDNTSIYVTPKDYEILKELISTLNDSNRWKVADEKTGTKTLTSVNNYYMNLGEEALPVICFTGLMSGDHKSIFNLFFKKSFEKKINSFYKRKFQLEYLKINHEKGIEYPNTIIYHQLDIGFPFTKREIVMARTIIPDKYNEETDEFDRFVIISKPSAHDDSPIKKDFIRVSLYTAVVIERQTTNSTRYYIFDFMDMKGSVPKGIVAGLSKMFASDMHKMVKKDIEKTKDVDEELLSMDGSLEVLKEQNKAIRDSLNL